METIAVLRSNIRDAGALKVIKSLLAEYKICYFAWDRNCDYTYQITDKGLSYSLFRVKSPFYSLATLFYLAFFNLWLLIKLLSSHFDFIHAIDLDTGITGLIAARIKRKPFIYHCLDPYFAALPPKWPGWMGERARKLENYLISKADLFVITDLMRLPQLKGAMPGHILEYANVPMETVVTSKESLKEDPSLFKVGYIGSLIEGRHLEDLLDVAEELEENKNLSFIIGGFGPLEKKIKELSEGRENITFTGYLPYSEVIEREKQFDIFFYCNDPESPSQKWVSPNKLFEAMMLGKPMITMEGTLVARRVSMTGNGLVIKGELKEGLKKALLELPGKPELLEEMGNRGRKEYLASWTIEEMNKRILDAYSKVRTGE